MKWCAIFNFYWSSTTYIHESDHSYFLDSDLDSYGYWRFKLEREPVFNCLYTLTELRFTYLYIFIEYTKNKMDWLYLYVNAQSFVDVGFVNTDSELVSRALNYSNRDYNM